MSALDTLLYGYRTILAATVAAAQRGKLNFSSAFTVADNAGTESTDVGLSGTQSITTATITTGTITNASLGSLVLGVENNALAGAQNNVAIGSGATIIRVTDAGAVTWTGMAGGASGRVVLIRYEGGVTLTLSDQDAASTAANRFSFYGGAPPALTLGGAALCVYDATVARWRSHIL